MRSFFLILTILAQSSLMLNASPVQEFLAAKNKYSTVGHKKANGLVITLDYPKTWITKEGERPNIVQKFISPSGMEFVSITIKPIPLPTGTLISESELLEFFTPTAMKDILPKGATFISANPTKIEGLPAGILEYSIQEERAGKMVYIRCTNYIFVYETTMVQLQCSVGALSTQSASIPQRTAEFMPLFSLMANSIVLENKWK